MYVTAVDFLYESAFKLEMKLGPHTEKSFRNLNKLNLSPIVFNIFQLIQNQTDVRLVPNQLENDKYNLIPV